MAGSKKSNVKDYKNLYELNGAIYVINVKSLKKGPVSNFKRILKYVMDDISSLDIDTPLDWEFAETIIEKKMLDLTT